MSSSNNKNNNNVRVGVGVVVQDPNNPHQLFAGVRKGSHGSGLLALPGGHLELMESWEECAIREVEEETGLILDQECVSFLHVTNDPMPSEHKHYITIFMMAKCQEGTSTIPKNLEPHKCEGWGSYTLDDLRQILEHSKEEVQTTAIGTSHMNKNSLGGHKDNLVASASASEELISKLSGLSLFGPLKHLIEDSPSSLDRFLS